MADKSTNTSGGIGLGGVLFIVFLILKLCGVVAWSWLWVTAPLWIPLAILALFLIVLGILKVLADR